VRATGGSGRLVTAPGASVLVFEGRTLPVRDGESVASALWGAGERCFRTTRDGETRGMFCGMGVCHECLVEIDGAANVRACMTKARPGMEVRRQPARARLSGASPATLEPAILSPDVLVVGGGAAGLSAAAAAAEAGARVTLIDERPAPGGQFFKQPATGEATLSMADDAQARAGGVLIGRARAAGVVFVAGEVIAATAAPLRLIALAGGRRITLTPRRVVVASGAYERPLPVPGWTLPGVITAGAAQTLLRSYGTLAGRRIVVAGNGPLNLQVACELMRAGATIAAVAEAAPAPSLASTGPLLAMAATAPDLLAKGAAYVAELRRGGVAIRYAAILGEVHPGLTAVLADLRSGRTIAKIDADTVCMGYGFLPSNELQRLLRCAQDWDGQRRQLVTLRDDDYRTSVPGVFAVGDGCGLNGAHVAMAEGEIAGMAAAAEARDVAMPAAQSKRRAGLMHRARRHRRFQSALWTLFAPARPLPDPAPEVVVCRCEGITAGAIAATLAGGSDRMGSLKRLTRLGMGRCQGRYCIPVAAEYLSRSAGLPCGEDWFAAPRPPLRPAAIAALASTVEE
jgi:NADPH-dependent 2,4-dienoyl-CoA reductase/sulfur reductase-like enzyme